MSKYYKADDVIRAIEEMQNCYNGWSDTYDKAQIIGVLEELPTIEVSEDCISREYLKSLGYINKGDFNSVETIREWIDNAPSVVPTTEQSSMVGEWKWESEDTCDNCGYEIPHIEKVMGDVVLMDSKDWHYCPNCGAKMKV